MVALLMVLCVCLCVSPAESALILIRHGESLWNCKNLFTGCVDVPLSQKGVEEAVEAGKRISDIPVDMIFTSALIRAQMTAMLAMTQHGRQKVHYLTFIPEVHTFSIGYIKQNVRNFMSYKLNREGSASVAHSCVYVDNEPLGGVILYTAGGWIK